MELTNREYEVLTLMAKQGLSNDHIANKLFISYKTVRNHISNIYKKLNVNSEREAIVFYYQNIPKGTEDISMKIRLQGLPDEIDNTVEKLNSVFRVLAVSKKYKNRDSNFVKVYVEVNLEH